MSSDISQLIVLLKDLLEGRGNTSSTREQLRQLQSDPSSFPKAEKIFAYLEHFLDDEDIRNHDEDYRVMQNQELGKLIYCLQHLDFETASKITFLGSS